MKFPFEIPDAIHRRAKVRAAKSGMTLSRFVTQVIQEQLVKPDPKPWMKHLGKLKHLKKDIAEIDRVIEEEFEKIDPELWK